MLTLKRLFKDWKQANKEKEYKELAKINKELTEHYASITDLSEEEVLKLSERIFNNKKFREKIVDELKKEVDNGLARRALLASGLGAMGIGSILSLLGSKADALKVKFYQDKMSFDDEFYLPIVLPFSAMAYIDKSRVNAINWRGKLIDKGEAGIEDAKVIQATVNTIGEGKIFISKGTYKITQKITCPAGVVFESEGATLDLTELDDVAFEFRAATYTEGKKTGLNGFKVIGDLDNANTKLAYFEEIARESFIQDCFIQNLNNVVEFAGRCFLARFENNIIINCNNVVKLTTTNNGANKPNGARIINNDFSGNWTTPPALAIYIGDNITFVRVEGNWIEAYQVGIEDHGCGTIIANNHKITTKYICIKLYPTSHVGTQATRIVNDFLQSTDDWCIYNYVKGAEVKVNDNTVIINKGLGFFNAYESVHGNFIGNTMVYYTNATSAVFIKGLLNSCEIVGNKLLGSVNSPRGIGLDLDTSSALNTIMGNTFIGLDKAINQCGVRAIIQGNMFQEIATVTIITNGYCEVKDNIFRNCTGFTFQGTDRVEGNQGYPTKNSDTKTFSGDGSTKDFLIGDHGLVVTDPNRIVVKVTPISQDAINASPCVGYVDPNDNTKIRVKFASAPASGTNNVKIAWIAEIVG